MATNGLGKEGLVKLPWKNQNEKMTKVEGSVSITLTDTQTATFTPDVLKYDVLLINGAGAKEYYLEGTIFVSEGYTST